MSHAEDLTRLDELIAAGEKHTASTSMRRRALAPKWNDDWLGDPNAAPKVRYEVAWARSWISWCSSVEVHAGELLGTEDTTYQKLRRLTQAPATPLSESKFVERRDSILGCLDQVRTLVVRRHAETSQSPVHRTTQLLPPEPNPPRRAGTIERRKRLAKTIAYAVDRDELRADASAKDIQGWLEGIDGEAPSNPRYVADCAEKYATLDLRTLQRDLTAIRSRIAPKPAA